MSIAIHRHSDATTFLSRAETWLLQREAEHNLLLGLAGRLALGEYPYEDPLYLATVEEGGAILGCAWRTPPHRLGLTRIPAAALQPLVEDVLDLYETLPGVHGAAAEDFARLWCKRKGVSSEVSMHLRAFQLDRVLPARHPVSGRLRRVRPREVELVLGWTRLFFKDAGLGPGDFIGMVERLIAAGSLYFWDDGQPRSMAAAVAPTMHGIRINLVFTPEAWRGQGFASQCVAALSQRQLDEGRRFCFLYTDLENPISNSIYARIGYKPVCDVKDVDFREE